MERRTHPGSVEARIEHLVRDAHAEPDGDAVLEQHAHRALLGQWRARESTGIHPSACSTFNEVRERGNVHSARLPGRRVRARGRQDDADVGSVELGGEEVRLARADKGELEPCPERVLDFGLEADERRDDVRALDLHDEGHLPLRNGPSVEICGDKYGWTHVLDFVEPHPSIPFGRVEQETAECRDLGAYARHAHGVDRDVHRA